MIFIINLSYCVMEQGSSQLSVKFTSTKLKMHCFYLNILCTLVFQYIKNRKKMCRNFKYYLLIDHNKCFTSTVKSYCPYMLGPSTTQKENSKYFPSCTTFKSFLEIGKMKSPDSSLLARLPAHDKHTNYDLFPIW